MAKVGELAFAGGNRKLLLLAVGAGLIAAILIFAAVQSGGDSGSGTSGATTAELVASKAIAAGATITADDVKVVNVPTALFVTSALTEAAPAVGQATRVAIAQGEPITAEKLGSAAKSSGLNSVVPSGKRAMALKVEQATAVGGLLLPGDHIDIVAVFGDRVSTVLQNIEILAVAQEAQKPIASSDSGNSNTTTSGQVPSDAKTSPNAGTLTLAVDPDQAELLAGVQQRADQIYTTLRRFGDQSTPGVPGVDLSTITGQPSPGQPGN